MGNALGCLQVRRAPRLMTLLQHSITRIALLKNRQQATFSFIYSDVIQLLRHGYQEEALARVEHVIKAQNTLDVYDIVESYCHLLMQNISLINSRSLEYKECPEELKEAIVTLIYVSSWIGEFPELSEIRDYFSNKFDQEFVSQVTEFPRFFPVNDKIMRKVSTYEPSLETRMNYLRDIAKANEVIN